MTKIEITDEIVTRFLNNMMGPFFGDGARERTKATLDAALNPPPEPEIEVTNEMLNAGRRVFNDSEVLIPGTGYQADSFANSLVSNIYRAMRALEPNPTRPVWTKVDQPPKRSRGDHLHARSHDVGYPHSHRRAGDPK